MDVLRLAKLTEDVAQNVNFAIKSTVLDSFLRSHDVKYVIAETGERLDTADLAQRAKAFTAAIQCQR